MASELSIGLSGITAARQSLQVTGNNIANISTDGYSRQEVVLTTKHPVLFPSGSFGTGVTIDQIKRFKDELLDSQIRSNTSLLGSVEIQSETLRNLEFFLNELSGYGLSAAIESFFQNVQGLSTDPEFTSSRNQLLQDGINLANTFNSLDGQIKQLQLDLSQKTESKVIELNSITSEIALLNTEIVSTELGEQVNANDLRDKRDALLGRLSKLGDIRVIENDSGSVNVILGGSLVVDGSKSDELTTFSSGARTVGVSGTLSLNSGEIKGLLEMQDVTIPKYLGYLDSLAASIIQEIDNIHSEGVGLSGGFTSLISTNAATDSTAALSSTSDTGLPFAPTITSYTTGTVTSDGSGTVTGTGTLFLTNVNANDWLEVSGSYYRILSVTDDNTLTVDGTVGAVAGYATNISNGNLSVTVEDSSGAITKTNMRVATDDTLTTLAARITSDTGLTASITNGILTITPDTTGDTFNFTKQLDTNPGSIGNSTVTLSGYYNGSDKDIFKMIVTNNGTGSIGTGSAVIQVTDAKGTVLANLDVGSSYTAGDTLQIADGVSVSFGSGTISNTGLLGSMAYSEIIGGTGTAIDNTTLFSEIDTGGNLNNIADGDTISISGTQQDGTAVAPYTYTITLANTIQNLLNDLEANFGLTTGSAVIDPNGKIQINDDFTGGSQLSIAFIENNEGGGSNLDFGAFSADADTNKVTFDVTNDPDTSNVLTVLGLNTFFKGNDAATIGVTQYIKDDVSRIAAASSSSSGDNTNALRLIDLQSKLTMNSSTATFSDFLESTTVELGVETRQKTSEKESFGYLLLSLNNRRQEVSGVSIEEEMINIIRFQQAFQASAKYISVIDELTNVLLGIKR